MGVTVGTQLGSHTVTALIGRGGMGEVWRARDSKLKREVAIKILPEEFSRDPERVARFQREAEVLASLNHPHIAAIHDVQEGEGLRYLVNVDRTRPLCPYPQTAQYKGTGSTDEAANFVCKQATEEAE